MSEVGDALLDPFRTGIGLRALIEVLVLGSVCGPLGVWVVLYRQSYAAESIAHAALPGLVIASLTAIPLSVGAGAGLAVAAGCVALASRLRTIDADVAIAVTVTSLFGLGTLLALEPSVPPRLGELLFGDPLGISDADLLASAGLAGVTLVLLAVLHRRLTLVGFDPRSAPSLGAGPAATSATLLLLLALTVLVAVQALGNLLVVAFIVAPAAAALRLRRDLGGALLLAAAIAAACGVAGVYASFYLDIAAGASIALATVVAFSLTLPLRLRRDGSRRVGGSPVDSIAGRD
jgi:ABC-type Mn2+/Zn2+ transport system permease subunit